MKPTMKHVAVVQHTQSEWLGAIEDHLEGRGIRFSYFRPFAAGGRLPDLATLGAGLILLGGGPFGAAMPGHQPATLDAEVRLARACLMHGHPVVGFGLGAQILSLAADGSVEPAELHFELAHLRRVDPSALGGLLPETFPAAIYMRDRPSPPAYAQILARDAAGRPAMFRVGANAFGLCGHPGIRAAMIEDLVMEHAAAPADPAAGLALLRRHQSAIEDALVPIMAGLVAACGWMRE